MQHFAKARQNMSKNQHFSHVMMLRFYFWCFIRWFAYHISHINVTLKTHMFYVVYFFTESNLDKK